MDTKRGQTGPIQRGGRRPEGRTGGAVDDEAPERFQEAGVIASDRAPVIADITMSLDGFIAGPNDGPENGLGDGGEVLHEWMWNGSDPEGAVLIKNAMDRIGSVVMGHRTFRIIDSPEGWRAPDGSLFRTPVFVVCHERSPFVTKGSTPFTFVTDGVAAAVARARSETRESVVSLMGASIIRQAIAQRLLRELCVHVVPVLLGKGVRLFDATTGPHKRLEKLRCIDTKGATHVWYRLVGEDPKA